MTSRATVVTFCKLIFSIRNTFTLRMKDNLIDEDSEAIESGIRKEVKREYSLLGLNNDAEYDVTQCSALCCIEEFKVRAKTVPCIMCCFT